MRRLNLVVAASVLATGLLVNFVPAPAQSAEFCAKGLGYWNSIHLSRKTFACLKYGRCITTGNVDFTTRRGGYSCGTAASLRAHSNWCVKGVDGKVVVGVVSKGVVYFN